MSVSQSLIFKNNCMSDPLTSIQRYRTIKSLSEITGYSTEIITNAIDFLLRIKVLKRVKDQIIPGEQHVHLSNTSKNIWRHHTNWRLAAIQRMDIGDPSDLHYSLAFSCSENDARHIKESLLSHLKSMSHIINTSKEDDAFVYCFDFFKWK